MKNTKKMKNSGIAWLGEIPEEWEVRPLWTIGDFLFSGIDKKINEDEFMVKMVNYTDVYGNKLATITRDIELMEVSCPKNKLEICMLKRGDMIFTPSSETIEDIGISAVIVDEIENTVFSYHTIRFRSKKIDLGYKKYVCNNHFVLNQFSRECKGTTRKILGREEFRWALVLLPPLPTQKAIADYLDKKTLQITKFINDKKKMIELLKEQKQAIIYNAVTKGIDKNVKMKNSGIAWLGEIPEGWEVRKVSRIFNKIGSGTTPNTSENKYYRDGVVKWVNTGDLNDGILYNCDKSISKIALDELSSLTIYPANSLVVAMYGATIGKISILNFEATVNQACCVLTNSNIANIMFIFYWFMINKQNIINLSYGGGQPNISQDIVKSLKIPLPPLPTQKAIADYLDKKTAEIETAIAKIQKEISLIEEYKKSLIYHAVTGKIDIEAVNDSIN